MSAEDGFVTHPLFDGFPGGADALPHTGGGGGVPVGGEPLRRLYRPHRVRSQEGRRHPGGRLTRFPTSVRGFLASGAPVPGCPGWSFGMSWHDTHAWHVPVYRRSDGQRLVGRGDALEGAVADAARQIRARQVP